MKLLLSEQATQINVSVPSGTRKDEFEHPVQHPVA
jgi:hypothetical protein